MKIVQINAWKFRLAQELLKFLKSEKPDIINLQEVTMGYFNNNTDKQMDFFELYKKELGMDGIYAKSFGVQYKEHNQTNYIGNAFLTSLPIIDWGYFHEPTNPDFNVIPDDHPFFSCTTKAEKYVYVFEFPTTHLWGLLEYKGKIVRNYTSHFTVSYRVTETLQTINHARSICRFLEKTKKVPTVLSGDFNICEDSSSIRMLEEKMDMVNMDSKNTINLRYHPGAKEDLKAGVKIDYIFKKGFSVKKVSTPDIDVSDHLPVVAVLEAL